MLSSYVGFVPIVAGAWSPGLSLPQPCAEVLHDCMKSQSQSEYMIYIWILQRKERKVLSQTVAFTCHTPHMWVGDSTAQLYNCRQHVVCLWQWQQSIWDLLGSLYGLWRTLQQDKREKKIGLFSGFCLEGHSWQEFHEPKETIWCKRGKNVCPKSPVRADCFMVLCKS